MALPFHFLYFGLIHPQVELLYLRKSFSSMRKTTKSFINIFNLGLFLCFRAKKNDLQQGFFLNNSQVFGRVYPKEATTNIFQIRLKFGREERPKFPKLMPKFATNFPILLRKVRNFIGDNKIKLPKFFANLGTLVAKVS